MVPTNDLVKALFRALGKRQNGCWIWKAGIKADGYGFLWIKKGNTVLAHRLSYELFVGQIPKGLFVCHRCDNPPCVNPDHLFLGTHAENMADCAIKGRYPDRKGEKHPMAKLTEPMVLEILRSSESHKELAERFGISQGNISQIKTGSSWNHIHKEFINSGGKVGQPVWRKPGIFFNGAELNELGERIIHMYQNGLNAQQVERKTGIDRKKVVLLAKECGIATKGSGTPGKPVMASGIRYDTFSGAKKSLGISSATLYRRLHSPDWPEYYYITS